MNVSYLRRRAFLLSGLGATALRTGLLPVMLTSSFGAEPGEQEFRELDAFISRYMLNMNAPGLTLALANASGTIRTAGFGYSDIEAKNPVTTDLLFEIGSISKSFVAITLLQLHDQGKLDLQRPILNYLPWLPIETNYGVITVHHLLTHTSGLPDALGLFLSDPRARHLQAFRPGETFHYCNAGFAILGHLIEHLDGRPFPDAVRARIFEPLGMTASLASIGSESRARRAQSYVPYFEDAPYSRQGRLAVAPNIVFDDAAGSIISAPADMARYMRMLILRGAGPASRIISEESFALFSKAYIKAEEFSPTASYGYGIAVDQLNGHRILRHTGGMVSFASAMYVDLDSSVAAFASINAMQGYRPNPVTQFAVEVLRAKAEAKPVPKPPELSDPSVVKNAQQYAGLYKSFDGREARVAVDGESLTIALGSKVSPLERSEEDVFVAVTPGVAHFPFTFERAEAAKEATSGAKNNLPVAQLTCGPDWYVNERYNGPKSYPEPPEASMFAGHYRGESAWTGSVEVVLRKGKLWVDGLVPLEPLGAALFRVGDDLHGPETAEFFYPVGGKARLLKMSGADLWRVYAG